MHQSPASSEKTADSTNAECLRDAMSTESRRSSDAAGDAIVSRWIAWFLT
eukprot:COSAG04_NODE_625_length_11793_cov_11.719942_3_plen_50_part_00